MTAREIREVERLYHAALERRASERQQFLADACGADATLLGEVSSLLAAHDEAGDFIVAPAVATAGWTTAAGDVAELTGTVGAYDIERRVGRGGMGEVYLAHDPRLGRKVAIKLLRSELTGHPDLTRRFEQEARAASALNHPNIVTIYEIGEVGERRFLAMEFVDGQPLVAFVGRPAGVAWVARGTSVRSSSARSPGCTPLPPPESPSDGSARRRPLRPAPGRAAARAGNRPAAASSPAQPGPAGSSGSSLSG